MKFLTLLALVIQIPAFAAAQPRPTGAEEAAGRRAPTTLEDQSKEGKAAEAAARRRAVEGDRVTYQQVLADPDNIDLNNRFARTQIAQEELHGMELRKMLRDIGVSTGGVHEHRRTKKG